MPGARWQGWIGPASAFQKPDYGLGPHGGVARDARDVARDAGTDLRGNARHDIMAILGKPNSSTLANMLRFSRMRKQSAEVRLLHVWRFKAIAYGGVATSFALTLRRFRSDGPVMKRPKLRRSSQQPSFNKHTNDNEKVYICTRVARLFDILADTGDHAPTCIEEPQD